jgi:hypothetical protein
MVTEGNSEVDRPGAAEHTNDEVAQARHRVWAATGPKLGSVFGEGDIADVVQTVLDRPVAPEVVSEPGGAGLREGEAAQLDAAVAAVAGAVQHGDVVPGKAGAAGQQRGLVGLDGEQVVRLLAGHQELGRGGVGMQRVGGHDHACKVQPVQQGLEGGHLTWGAVDLALGEHRAGGVLHRSEQVGWAAVAAGAAQRLAVDCDGPPALAGALAVGKPPADRSRQRLGIQAGQRPADRGLGGDRPATGERVAEGPERGADRLGCVRGPLGNRGDRPRTGQDRSSGERQDGDQRVATPSAGPGVGDGRKVGEQVRCPGWSQRLSLAKDGQAGWDRR